MSLSKDDVAMPTCFGDELRVHAGAAVPNHASMVPQVPTHSECQPGFLTMYKGDVEQRNE